ncbi:MAG: insulinase family protein, partial [Myxococcales bacterium]|nr:insulinase family protein [Myxococcales bacterium]
TPADLLEVARRWLVPERSLLGAVLPEDTRVDEDALREALSSGVERCLRRYRAPCRSPAAGRSSDVESFELANGARLHVVARRELPIVALRFAMLGGLLAEDSETAGANHFLAGMWMRGTHARSAAGFARAVEALAGDVDGFSGRNSIGLTIEGTSDRILPLIDLGCEALLAPALAEEELTRECGDTLAALARREDRLGARAFDLFAQALYPTHPYRFSLLGEEATVKSFTPQSQRALHDRLVRGGNLDIGCVGDVDPEALASDLSVRLAELPEGPPGFDLPPEDPFPDSPREVVQRKDRSQAHLVLGFPGLRLDDEDRYALEVIAQVLGGQAGRLFLELRDKQSLAYSVSAFAADGVATGYFAFTIATAPEKFEVAKRGLFDEVERLLDEPPDEAELEAAKRQIVGSFVIEGQRAGARAFHMALDARYGLGADSASQTPERVRAVSRADVTRVAARVFDLNRYVLAVVRP